jgi:hypothetical protein
MERLWLWLKAFLEESLVEWAKGSIATAMWTDGYTDDEIADEIRRLFPEKEEE